MQKKHPLKSKKNKTKSLFRRINDWLHLWLGLATGIVVFIVSITGCIYVFQKEIKDAMEPWRFVPVRNTTFIPPSELVSTAKQIFPNKKPTGLTYAPKNEAAAVGFEGMENGKHTFSVVFLDPYDAKVLKAKTWGEDFDFFKLVIDGHRALWLPYDIGRPIVGVSTLIFILLIVSGLIMWWPKKWKKNHIKQAFSIKFSGRFKRVNYDLHNVLGFYSFVLALVIAITGLVWSFQWFQKGLYYVTSGGKALPEHVHPHSDESKYTEGFKASENIDKAWFSVMKEIGEVKGGMYISPEIPDKDDPIEITVYNLPGKYYDKSDYFFDQYTLKTLRQKGDRYKEADFADQLSMLNYDIHIGAVWGLAGKLLAFFISLICASLPITGFLVWWGKRKA